MTKEVLWVDNDAFFLKPYRAALRNVDISTQVVGTVGEAEECLLRSGKRYDLVIIDVMIPTDSEEEEKKYPPEKTDDGLKLGLEFYKTVKDALAKQNIPVLAMTVRIDPEIHDEFVEAGLPDENFVTKQEYSKAPDFVRKVQSLLPKESD